jgi:microsomal dipeptidase-like Zn-dependent dipeptidase
VWSHSSVGKTGATGSARSLWQMRQLGLDQAKAIASKGGVVGLWALRSDVGSTVEAYGDRLIEMAGWLGEDHVAFGTDMNALGNSPVSSYADLRRVVRHLERKLAAGRVQKIAMGNYARVLRQVMEAAKA